jgi:hypothetical protein
MSKIVAALVVLATAVAVGSTAGAGCSSTVSPYVTGCTAFLPADAGTTQGLTCAIGWSCSSNSTQYQITCVYDETQPAADNYTCTCNNGSTTTDVIHVNAFICDPNQPEGALPVANMGCGFNLAM